MTPFETSLARLVSAEPVLEGAGPLKELSGTSVPDRTLFHAGPPYTNPNDIPTPVMRSAAVASMVENWAKTEDEARVLILKQDIRLQAAQDHGLVLPLAFVAGPSTGMLSVMDQVSEARILASINDGPPPAATRFGAPTKESIARLSHVNNTVAPQLAECLKAAPMELLPIAGEALRQGDELHSQVEAANTHFVQETKLRGLGNALESYLQDSKQFFLNIWMGACATMLQAGAGVPDSTLIIAAGGNGQEVGLKLSKDPETWIYRKARPPEGPRLSPILESLKALPAVGDSAVIDVCGFGAQAMEKAPLVASALTPYVPNMLCLEPSADHPSFDLAGIRVGMDYARLEEGAIFANLALLDAEGRAGLLGRGIAAFFEAKTRGME